ncbi:MAG: iron-sulfur cluster repair di-iron protein [Victivallaceae bacterium]
MTTSQKLNSEIRPDTTVGELVVHYPQLRQLLETLKIDYCCGGSKPLIDAVQAAGQEWPAVLSALSEALKTERQDANRDWNNASLGDLIDHIIVKHHNFTKEQLLRLDGLLARVQKAHGAHHADMLSSLRRLYDALRFELDPHLLKEEQILFPAIKGIDDFMSGTGERPVIHCGSIANPIQQMEYEHNSAGTTLADMRQTTDNYRLPSDACQTFAALYDGLKALEADLHEHIHLENNILFPKSVELEEKML